MEKRTRRSNLGTNDRSVRNASRSKTWRSILSSQRGNRSKRNSEVALGIIGVLGFIFVIWMVVMFT